jgi:hypothetical protein
MRNPWFICIARPFLRGNSDMQPRVISALVLAWHSPLGAPAPVAAVIGKTVESFNVSSMGSAAYSAPSELLQGVGDCNSQSSSIVTFPHSIQLRLPRPSTATAFIHKIVRLTLGRIPLTSR